MNPIPGPTSIPHEGSRPNAIATTWRPALRILEHAWGRPKETVELQDESEPVNFERLGLAELERHRRSLLAGHVP